MGIKDWTWTFISGGVTITAALASTLIYTYIKKKNKQPVNKQILIWFVICSLLVGLIAGGVYYSIVYKPSIPTDGYSESRVTKLGQLFSSYFGPYWPYMFIVFVVFLLIILAMVFFYTRNGVTLNINEDSFIVLKRYLLWFGAAITLGVAAISSWAFAKYAKEKKEEASVDGDFVNDNTKFKLYMGVAVFSAVIVGVVGLILFYLIRHEIKVHNNKKN